MTFSLVFMLLFVVLQGLFFFARDAVTAHLPIAFAISDYSWLCAFLSVFCYRRFPGVTATVVPAMFIVIAAVTQPYAKHPSALWFVLSNFAMIFASAFSLCNWYVLRTRQEDPTLTT